MPSKHSRFNSVTPPAPTQYPTGPIMEVDQYGNDFDTRRKRVIRGAGIILTSVVATVALLNQTHYLDEKSRDIPHVTQLDHGGHMGHIDEQPELPSSATLEP